MRDAVEFFEQALAEEGIDATVAREDDVTRQADTFYVMKSLGDEELTYQTSIAFGAQHRGDPNRTERLKKRLVQEAKRVAQEFEEYLTDTFEWDNRRVRVSPYEGGWAKCCACGTHVELPQIETIFTQDAELTTPQPHPRDTEQTISNLCKEKRLLLKMYLAGRLRERCDMHCANSKYNDLHKPHHHRQLLASD